MVIPLETLGFDTAIDWRGLTRADLLILVVLVIVWQLHQYETESAGKDPT